MSWKFNPFTQKLDQAGGGDLLSSNNLSDVVSAPTALSNLIGAYAGNTLKVVRVNAGETDLEYTDLSGGGLSHPQVMARLSMGF